MTGIDVTPAVRAATERITPEWDLDASILWPQVADDAVTAALPHLAEAFARLVEDEAPKHGALEAIGYVGAGLLIRIAATNPEETS